MFKRSSPNLDPEPQGGGSSFFRDLVRLRFLRRKRIWLLIVILAVLYVFFNSMFVYVRPNEFGIKVVKFGGKRGVQEQVYNAGYHFLLPMGIHQMHRLPRDTQVLEMTNSPSTAAFYSRQEKAAHIQTSDGFFVDVDVSVLYRIKDPHKVFTLIGPGKLFEDNGIIPKTEPVLKEMLGELTTEEFYISTRRVERTQAAKQKLNAELEPKGLHVDELLVRYFKYSDEIQKNIEERKLKDQMVFKNQAERRAAEEGAKLKKVMQEGEMSVAVKLSEGEAFVTTRRAEKDLYVRSQRAKGDLMVKLAEAKKAELRNAALQGQGSDRMVGLAMADAFKGLEVVVLSSDGADGINPLNLDKTLKLLGVRQGGE